MFAGENFLIASSAKNVVYSTSARVERQSLKFFPLKRTLLLTKVGAFFWAHVSLWTVFVYFLVVLTYFLHILDRLKRYRVVKTSGSSE